MIYVKQNDALPKAFTVLSKNGTAVNLATATGVTFRMRDQFESQGNPPKVQGAGAIVDAAKGEVEYAWVGTDTDTPGLFYAEWTVAFPAGDETFPTLFADVVLVEARVSI